MGEKITKAWFQRAMTDLKLARLCLAQGEEFLGPSVFHSQQAAEKAIKGFLAFHKVRFPKTHDMRILSQLLERVSPQLLPALGNLDKLTKYAVAYRYPDAAEEDLTAEHANEAIAIAENAYGELYSRVSIR